MSDLSYVAIALALNPRFAEDIRRDPQTATESVGLRLTQEELTRVSSIVRTVAPGTMAPPAAAAAPVAVRGHFAISGEAMKNLAAKVRFNAAERQEFMNDPAGYLNRNGISVPAEMLPSADTLRNLVQERFTSRHDPGSVAIAV